MCIRNVKYWTAEEDKVLVENWPNLNTLEIMKLIQNRTSSSISHRVMRLGLKKGVNYKKKHIRGKIITKDKFIERSMNKHGKTYNYSSINYVNYETPVVIKCNIHKIKFEQVPYNHVSCIGCPACLSKKVSLGKETFVNRCIGIHGNRYDYSLVKYVNMRTKVKIICHKHGEFIQKPDTHLAGHGCSSCSNSKNEDIIANFLINNKIQFIREKTFDGCRYKNKLRFDFYLQDLNMCIEYDGAHHFDLIYRHGGEEKLNVSRLRDKIKTDFCKKNNIQLLRITYKQNTLEELAKFFTNKI